MIVKTGIIRSLGVAVGLALAGCSPHAAEGASSAMAATAPVVHPQSGLAVIPLSVGKGAAAHQFRVEVARSTVEQAKGLMFRTEMGADEGMIFPMEPARMAAFWMKNTVIPLDIIFIAPDRTILNIAAEAEPYSETSLPSNGPVAAVLELNGGRAAALGIRPGDRVNW